MSKEVQHFLDQMGANKVATTPYKPTSNGSVERFHAYLGQSISHVVKRTHEDWDKHMDSILFAYRTTPLDGLNVTPFEIVYGRTPNLPIDNLLARDSCTEPIDTPEQHIAAVVKSREQLLPTVQTERRRRFERNQRADWPGEEDTAPCGWLQGISQLPKGSLQTHRRIYQVRRRQQRSLHRLGCPERRSRVRGRT